jgi:antitoxin MazE
MRVDTQIGKWGNSLAIRIPQSIAKSARLSEGERIELDLTSDGEIVLRLARKRYDLDELVSGITAKNRHGETDWGTAMGKETW